MLTYIIPVTHYSLVTLYGLITPNRDQRYLNHQSPLRIIAVSLKVIPKLVCTQLCMVGADCSRPYVSGLHLRIIVIAKKR